MRSLLYLWIQNSNKPLKTAKNLEDPGSTVQYKYDFLSIRTNVWSNKCPRPFAGSYKGGCPPKISGGEELKKKYISSFYIDTSLMTSISCNLQMNTIHNISVL